MIAIHQVKWCEVDSTNQKGIYQLHIPDAAIASGVAAVTLSLQATGVIDKAIRLKLETPVNVVQADGQTVSATGAVDFDDLATTLTRLGTPTDTDVSTDISNLDSALSNIANVGSAVSTVASSYTLTTGTQSSGTITSTEALDGTNHEHTDDAGAMELYYEFSIGSGIASDVDVEGYLNGSNDSLGVFGYDWVAASWVQVGTLSGKNASTNETNAYKLTVAMTGSGANEGLVRLRFYAASGLTSATLAVDRILCEFSLSQDGYDNGAVWFDSNSSNTNTQVGVDGTARNPVSTSAIAIDTLSFNEFRESRMQARLNVNTGGSVGGVRR